jgi:HK97 family phage portal protein
VSLIKRAIGGQRAHPSQTGINWNLYGFNNLGVGTASGKEVTEESAMQLSTVFACIRVLSETVASLPLHLYRRLPDNGKEKAWQHWLYPLLHAAPNPEMTALNFRESIMVHLTAWGNAYIHIIKDNTNRITELWPMRPDRMVVERDDGKLTYKFTSEGKVKVFRRDEILHIPALGFDGTQGYSPIAKAREAIGMGLAAEEYGAKFFANDATPGLAITHPGDLSDTAKDSMRRSWRNAHMGSDKSHNVAILDEGIKVEKIGITPRDAQFLEVRKFQVPEICRIFRVPPHMVADLDRATFSNIEEQQIDFVVYSILPWCKRIEACLTNRLVPEANKRQYFFEHNIDGKLRGNTQDRFTAYATARQWGWMSINDIREKENMNPIGPEGDVYLVPLNMGPADMLTDPLILPDGSQVPKLLPPVTVDARAVTTKVDNDDYPQKRRGIHEAYRDAFLNTANNIAHYEATKVLQAVRKHFDQRNMGSWQKWMDKFYAELPQHIKNEFYGLVRTYVEVVQKQVQVEIGQEPQLTDDIVRFIDKYLDSYSHRHVASSVRQLNKIIDETDPEDVRDSLEQRALEWSDRRPGKIAMNETDRVGNAVAALTAFAIGMSIRWQTTGSSSCPWCRSLNGKVVGQSGFYVQGGEEFQPDGTTKPMRIRHTKKHPPLHAGCDCMVIFK